MSDRTLLAGSACLPRKDALYTSLTCGDSAQDIGPRYAGVLLGLTNTAGVLAGVISTAATGYILSVGSWNDVWASAIVFYIIGTVIWNTMSTGEQIFD